MINFNNKKSYVKQKKIHLGFSILKVFLALNVIKSHCFNEKSTNSIIIQKLTKRRRIHVPSFVILSFYFTHNTLVSRDLNKIYERFERLLIPYIGWPIIILIGFNLLHYIFQLDYQCTLKNFFYQIIIAQAPNMPLHFWFLFDLIVTNMIFVFIILLKKKQYLLIFHFMLLLSYYMQYSKINLILYSKCKSKQSLGREIDIIPFSITGFFLSEFNIIDKLQNIKFITFISSLFFYNLSGYYGIFLEIQGVAYSGLKLNTHSLCIIFIFSLISLEKVKIKYLKRILIEITKFTGGIFYLHQIVKYFFQFIFIDIKKGTFFGLFLIYLFSYLICFLGTLISCKTKARFLFS